MGLPTLRGSDIGGPAFPGTTRPVGTGWDLTGGGADIWESSDQFHFAWTERTGDFDLAVRVEALEAGHLYTKAGLMARESLDPGAAHAFHLVFPTNAERNHNNGGVESQVRPQPGAGCRAYYPPRQGVGDPEFPVAFPDVWLRLTRRGNGWTAWAGDDGRHWTVYARFDLVLAPRLLVGPAVTAHDDTRTVTARFRDFQEVGRV